MVLNKIFHISDIHIRNGDEKFCRFNEYNSVFDRLFQTISSYITQHNLSQNEFIIIISGDIFHNKNVIGNYGLALYKKFIKGLTDIGKTIIFHGNHDKNQNETNQPSLIASAFEIDNLILLNESTSFVIDDIGFSYVSIDDTLDKFKSCGRVENLPSFPIINSNTRLETQIRHKIALFHGTFGNVKLNDNMEAKDYMSPYPFEWIKDFDFAILGDIHLRQHDTFGKTLWGYAGSLIQQNYGEDVIQHGFMVWDLNNRDIEYVNVYNEFGYINVKQEDKALYANSTTYVGTQDTNYTQDITDTIITMRYNGKYQPLEIIIKNNIEMFPKNIDIKSFSQIDFLSLLSLFNKYEIKFNIVNNKILHSTLRSSQTTKTDNLNTISDDTQELSEVDLNIDKNTILRYFEKHISQEQHSILTDILSNNEKLLIDVSKYPDDMKDECHKKNKEITQVIKNCTMSEDVKKIKHQFTIKYLEWSNLYCYENRNWIDFSKTDAETFLVSGANGIGKSAIYDIMTLAIWGEITPLKQNPISNGMINHKHSNAYCLIDVCISGETYRIVREFVRKDNNTSNISKTSNKKNIMLFKVINDHQTELIQKDVACNEKIKMLFGTIDDFLSSSMITQNVDFDILKMNYKDCVSLIDKATNIDYIYNLYDLFKCCLHKYKDLKKIIISKKQVYEKLLASCKLECVDEETNDENVTKLMYLEKEKETLVNENNSIAIDMHNPLNIYILNTTEHFYDNLISSLDISSLDDIDTTNATHILQNLRETFNELKVFFKNTNEDDILELKNAYRVGHTDYENLVPVEKSQPCNYEFIENEEYELSKLNLNQPTNHNNNSIKYTDLPLNELQNILDNLKKLYDDTIDELKTINDDKPVSVIKPTITYLQIIDDIFKMYENTWGYDTNDKPDVVINQLISYCLTNPLMTNNNSTSTTTPIDKLTYEIYLQSCQGKDIYQNSIVSYKITLKNIDTRFDTLYAKQKQLTLEMKNPKNVMPTETIPDASLDNACDIKEKLDTDLNYDIYDIKKSIEKDEEILETFYKGLDNIKALEDELTIYKNELTNLNTTDEYKFNPDCEYCCKRSWVIRIKELNVIINSLETNIETSLTSLYDNAEVDYINIYNTNEENKVKLSEYELYHKWYDYYLFKEEYDEVDEEINNLLKEKKNVNIQLINDERMLNSCMKTIISFNILSHKLYEKYNNIVMYEQYDKWKQSYDSLYDKKVYLEREIEFISNHLIYVPRLEKLNILKSQYDEWEIYNNTLMIVKANEFFEIKSKINTYENYLYYIECKKLKPDIKRKHELFEKINELDIDIKVLNDTITKHQTFNTYYKSHYDNNEMLANMLGEMENLITIIEIIIDKFKDYRKELYDTLILKNLVYKTNKYLTALCHQDTKKFELDYFISEVKDVIHINWLIKNTDLNLNNQIGHGGAGAMVVSISQASGFQRFVISLALRMSLFSNKQCTQLFFDEGFTAFDKNNLSIVPSFLKSLLKLFDSIIVVSHIDLIQENVDKIAHITYDKKNKSSSINYGEPINQEIRLKKK